METLLHCIGITHQKTKTYFLIVSVKIYGGLLDLFHIELYVKIKYYYVVKGEKLIQKQTYIKIEFIYFLI